MAYTRDLERIVRQFKRQRLDPEYIAHYLMETYQADPKVIEEVFRACGLLEEDYGDGNPMGGGRKKDDKIKKDRFKSFFS